ncbi:hypothetical protein QWY82_10480 [Simiduia curdlanivorans]|uniref:Uncharacterized protein n=1 Tax=Simiduia curdlanivorans TaxID=1492769 RepID=A0ABV8V189_9GAMM|nr:hypothetical protein [Simiduia curdlanivorans]MDN3639236.1 hypothetical protein [Simiduia curdlanivorans]
MKDSNCKPDIDDEKIRLIRVIQKKMKASKFEKVIVETDSGEQLHIPLDIFIGNPANNIYNTLTRKAEHIARDARNRRVGK